MNIGFFAQGEGPWLTIAKHLIESARYSMPDTPIFHLTDGPTRAMAEPIRIAEDMPMGVRRVTHYSRLEGEWLFLDTDTLIRKDVAHVFDKTFDVAVCSRDGTYMEGTNYARMMPYNFGVVFSRNKAFWEMLLRYLREHPPASQEWGGEQQLTCDLVGQQDSPFSVKVLPSSYNFTPYRQDEDVSSKHILHLKGPRHGWIDAFARAA